MSFWRQIGWKNLFLEDLGWIQVFFEKLLISYSCISFMKYCVLRSFCIKLLCFSKKKNHFSRFLIDRSCFLTDRNCDKNFWFESAWLDWHSIDAPSIETEKFQFLSIWPNFFYASFMFRIHMPCIIFCIHLAVLQSYLSLFHT